jgi:hypothetical protein
MSVSLRLSAISRLAGVVAVTALWLCCAGPARAGDGGSSGISLQVALDGICSTLANTTTTPPWCPQFATVTQQVIESAGLINQAPDIVRVINSACTPPGCPQVAVNAVNGRATSPPLGSFDALWYLTPLAFSPGTPSTAGPVATQNGDPGAKNFFYAVTLTGTTGQPQTIALFYDLPGTNRLVVQLALSLPLVVLDSGGSERPVAATLNATCIGFACVNPTVSGYFKGNTQKQTYSAGALGLNLNFAFVPSPNSAIPHPVVELQVPLVVTMQNDPAYFTTSPCPAGVNPISGYCGAFSKDVRGSPTNFIGMGKSVGFAPYAAPLCNDTTCPGGTPTSTSPSYFGFCASVSNSSVIQAFTSIGTDGTTYSSTPTPGAASTTQCPS